MYARTHGTLPEYTLHKEGFFLILQGGIQQLPICTLASTRFLAKERYQ